MIDAVWQEETERVDSAAMENFVDDESEGTDIGIEKGDV